MLLSEAIASLQNLTQTKVTYEQVGKVLGISNQAVSNRIQRGVELKEFEWIKLKEHFAGFDKDEYIGNLAKDYVTQKTNVSNGEFVSIPVLGDVSASCGYGTLVDNESQTTVYPVSSQLIRQIGANEKFCEMIFATGDSMEPEIKHGDALMVDCSKKDVIDGQIYIIRYDKELMCKRLQKLPPKRIKVISDNNRKYESYTIDLSSKTDIDFEIIGRVMFYSRIAR